MVFNTINFITPSHLLLKENIAQKIPKLIVDKYTEWFQKKNEEKIQKGSTLLGQRRVK